MVKESWGGQVVSARTYYSDDPSLNPTDTLLCNDKKKLNRGRDPML